MDHSTGFRDLTSFFLYLLFISTIGPLLFGYHLAELNTPQDIITCQRKSLFSPDTTATSTLPQCIPMSPAQIGVVQSIYTLGGLFGALAAGPVSSRYGRLRTMQLTTVFFIAGPALEAPAPNIATLAIGRLISGIGAGSSLVSVPIYISEISPPERKGFFGSFTQIMVNVGILLTQLLGYFLSKGQLWRLVLGIGGGIGLIQVFGLFLSVESPKWLADHGHTKEANQILRKIRSNNSNIDEEFASWGVENQDEFHIEAEALLGDEHHERNINANPANGKKQENKEVLGMLDVIKHPDYAKATFAVIMIMIAQQLTGKHPSRVAMFRTN
jgi:MFS family permease